MSHLRPRREDESLEAGCKLARAFLHEAAEPPPRAQDRRPTCLKICQTGTPNRVRTNPFSCPLSGPARPPPETPPSRGLAPRTQPSLTILRGFPPPTPFVQISIAGFKTKAWESFRNNTSALGVGAWGYLTRLLVSVLGLLKGQLVQP